MPSHSNRKKLSILIVSMSTIGEIVMATPVATALKRHNPNYRITWVVQPEFRSLLDGNPNVDEVLVWDYADFSEDWYNRRIIRVTQKLLNLRRLLKQFKFDMTLDLQGVFKSGMVTWLTGANHRIALGSEEGSNWFMTKTISRNLGDRVQLGSEYRYLVNQLGISDYNWQMYIPTNDEIKSSSARKLQEKIGDESFAVICPFSNNPAKMWDNSYWQQIILRIRGRYKLRTLILGGSVENHVAEEIASATGAISLVGSTTILEAAEIIRKAKLVIGVDTGLTHIAHALDTPTLALFGPTFPYAFSGKEASDIIHIDMYCSPCDLRPTCGGKYTCMKNISPDKVLTEIKPLIIASDHDFDNRLFL